jgi:hypothetical protein
VKSSNYKAVDYAVFSNLWVKIFSSAPCSQKASAYVLPLISEIVFHSHAKIQSTKLHHHDSAGTHREATYKTINNEPLIYES